MATALPFSVAACVGVVSHLAIFIHGEWEKFSPNVAVAHLIAALSLGAILVRLQDATIPQLTVAGAGYLAGLFGSVAIYRLLFHPLKHFPGPLAAKLSAFWSVKQTLQGFQWHITVQNLHQKYGDFVRIRPREISIIDPIAVREVHGPGTKCIKGPFYDLNWPSRSLQMTRDKSFHSQRRRVWDRGFGTKALTGYEPRIMQHCNELLSKLSELQSKPIHLNEWFDWFGFDVMGDLTFAKSYDMLSSNRYHWILKQIGDINPLVGVLVCVPWLFILFQHLPFIKSKRGEWIQWCAQEFNERRSVKSEQSDLFTHLIDDDSKKDKAPPVTDGDLVFDTELAIVAGSETTANALAAVFYLLSKHPNKLKELQAEIDPLFTSEHDFQHSLVVGKPLLESIIHEALRLFPPVPSGMYRLTPPEGAMIAGQWIPGDTVISTPTYTIQRDARNFVRPDDFIPERWTTQPELILRKDAYLPFSLGAYSCAGKPLAYMEMRMMISLMVRKFDVQFVNTKENIEVFEQAPGMKDYFTSTMAPLNVFLTPRPA